MCYLSWAAKDKSIRVRRGTLSYKSSPLYTICSMEKISNSYAVKICLLNLQQFTMQNCLVMHVLKYAIEGTFRGFSHSVLNQGAYAVFHLPQFHVAERA